jgi:hypothetical protein
LFLSHKKTGIATIILWVFLLKFQQFLELINWHRFAEQISLELLPMDGMGRYSIGVERLRPWAEKYEAYLLKLIGDTEWAKIVSLHQESAN